MQTNKIIRVEMGVRLALAKRFDLHPNYVSSILTFLSNAGLAQEVRKAAMEDFGGTLLQVVEYKAAKNKEDLLRDKDKSIFKKIKVEIGGRIALSKRFKIRTNYVSSILGYSVFYGSPDTAYQVRKAAMKDFGGTLLLSLNYNSAKNKADLIRDNEKVTLLRVKE